MSPAGGRDSAVCAGRREGRRGEGDPIATAALRVGERRFRVFDQRPGPVTPGAGAAAMPKEAVTAAAAAPSEKISRCNCVRTRSATNSAWAASDSGNNRAN